jgi:hypothetical protein
MSACHSAVNLDRCESLDMLLRCAAAHASYTGGGTCAQLPTLGVNRPNETPIPSTQSQALQGLDLLLSAQLLELLIQQVQPELGRRGRAEVRALQAMAIVSVKVPQRKRVVPG